MASYRFYGLNHEGGIVSGQYFECDGTAQAWEAAKPMLGAYPGVEVWDGDRLVFRIARDMPLGGSPAIDDPEARRARSRFSFTAPGAPRTG